MNQHIKPAESGLAEVNGLKMHNEVYGDGKPGLPQSRLAIIPGTTHLGMMKRTDWLIPMITGFLDSALNAPSPTF